MEGDRGSASRIPSVEPLDFSDLGFPSRLEAMPHKILKLDHVVYAQIMYSTQKSSVSQNADKTLLDAKWG